MTEGRRAAPACPMSCRTKTRKVQKMRRLYIKEDKQLRGVAWICPQCAALRIDDAYYRELTEHDGKQDSA